MTWTERIIIAAIILLLTCGLYAYVANGMDFSRACKDAGGVAVHDGRQWQCIKPQPGLT